MSDRFWRVYWSCGVGLLVLCAVLILVASFIAEVDTGHRFVGCLLAAAAVVCAAWVRRVTR